MAENLTASRFVPLSAEQSQELERILSIHNPKIRESAQALEDVFQRGIPVNGLLNPGPDTTLLERAIHHRNVYAMECLIDLDHTLVQDPESLLGRCIFNKACTDKLLQLGYSFKHEMERRPDFFSDNALYMDPSYIRDFARLGVDLNAEVSFHGDLDMPLLVQAGRVRPGKTIEILLESGADPEVRGHKGVSFLHTAVTNTSKTADPRFDLAPVELERFDSILKAAVAANVSLHMTDDDGRTPLHIAAKMGYLNKTNALLAYGADPTIKDSKGRTPEMLAKASKRQDVAVRLAASRVRETILDVVRKAAGAAARPA